jgi:hypothetical protein
MRDYADATHDAKFGWLRMTQIADILQQIDNARLDTLRELSLRREVCVNRRDSTRSNHSAG